jgi:hypothetical protein
MNSKTSANKLSFILYEKDQTPKYFEVRKSIIKLILFGLPAMTIASFVVVAVIMTYFQYLKQQSKKQIPRMIQTLNEEKNELNNEIKVLKGFNQKLQLKLASSSVAPQSTLPIFTIPPGQQNLTGKYPLEIENLKSKIVDENKNIALYFDLINKDLGGKRISGYLFVVMRQGNKILFYPKESIDTSYAPITFNKGESFAFSNLRPVRKSVFEINDFKTPVFFKILIYSLSGDIIFTQDITHKFGA